MSLRKNIKIETVKSKNTTPIKDLYAKFSYFHAMRIKSSIIIISFVWKGWLKKVIIDLKHIILFYQLEKAKINHYLFVTWIIGSLSVESLILFKKMIIKIMYLTRTNWVRRTPLEYIKITSVGTNWNSVITKKVLWSQGV